MSESKPTSVPAVYDWWLTSNVNLAKIVYEALSEDAEAKGAYVTLVERLRHGEQIESKDLPWWLRDV